jgi:hypothetical protein
VAVGEVAVGKVAVGEMAVGEVAVGEVAVGVGGEAGCLVVVGAVLVGGVEGRGVAVVCFVSVVDQWAMLVFKGTVTGVGVLLRSAVFSAVLRPAVLQLEVWYSAKC